MSKFWGPLQHFDTEEKLREELKLMGIADARMDELIHKARQHRMNQVV